MKTPLPFYKTISFVLFNLILLVCISSSQIQAQNPYYVDASASGSNDGSSWSDAWVDLQDALNNAGMGDTIWVAQGTYLPTATADRTIYFEIPDGVSLYGGFDGSESQLDQRDYENNQTILSGDIGMVDDSTDNSYHVVYFYNASNRTRLNGFVVTGGHTGFFMPQSEEPDPSIFSDTLGGGGIVNVAEGATESSNPAIENCLITGNTGMLGAGFCNYTDAGTTGPSIQKCMFENNTGMIGGGMNNFVFNNGLCEASIDSCLFADNKAEMVSGGGFASMSMGGESSPVLQYCSFENNSANEGGGFAVSAMKVNSQAGTANPELYYCAFSGNRASQDGGGIITNVSPDCQIELTLDSCAFEYNKAYEEGGGMDFDADSAGHATLHMTNCTFNRDSAVSHEWAGGGGINLNAGTDGVVEAILDSCEFESTYASDLGGGIRLQSDSAATASLDLSYCLFHNNRADSSSGGGLFSSSYANGINNTTITNCTFHSNHARDQGAGIFIACDHAQISPEIDQSTFEGNTAIKQGGAMYHACWGTGGGGEGENTPVLTHCTFENNTSTEQEGGAVYSFYSNAAFHNCTFLGNIAYMSGGAISSNNSHMIMDDCSLTGNESMSKSGGAINNWKSDPTITNSTLANNISYNNGGGINNASSSPVLIHCNLHDNSAGQHGGAMATYCQSESIHPIVKSSFIANNSAGQNGGGLYNHANNGSNNPKLINCVFYGNTSGSPTNGGGAICNTAGNNGTCNPVINNCTMSGNTASNSGGAMYNAAYTATVDPMLTNSIVWNNTVTGGQIFNQNANPSYSYSNIEGSGGSGSWNSSFGTNNGNNIDSDPSFTNAADTSNAPHVTCNLDLNAWSPAIDKGTPDTAGLNLPENDIRNNPRILLQQVDMGAYEADTLAPTLTTADTTIQLDPGGYALLTVDKVVQNASDDGVLADTLLSQEEFDCSDLGSVTVDITLVDNVGNQTTESAEVTVADTVKPVLYVDPETVYLDENGEASVTKEKLVHEATDNCSLMDTTIGQAAFTCADLGDNGVEVTLTDHSDNATTELANVEVKDSINPTITCPGDQSVDADESNTYTVSGTEFDPTDTTDNCGITITNDFNNSESLDGASFSSGTTTVTWTVTDGAGNTADCSFEVTVDEYVGMRHLSDRGITLYPNPTSSQVMLEFADARRIKQILVHDLTGRQIMQRSDPNEKETIDLSEYKSGMYFISIQTDKEVFTTRVIKN